jgi:hypothetical protein
LSIAHRQGSSQRKFSPPIINSARSAREAEGAGVTNINETIDGSVFERWRADTTYRPPALRAWAESKGVDPGKIICAVRTDDPKVMVGD